MTTEQEAVSLALQDRRWWERVGALLGYELIGFTGRIIGTFQMPLGRLDGLVAKKLLQLQTENTKLREVCRPDSSPGSGFWVNIAPLNSRERKRLDTLAKKDGVLAKPTDYAFGIGEHDGVCRRD